MSPRTAVALAGLFLLLGWNTTHYWDEYFYLYSVLLHSPRELASYELQTHLFPVGFFSEKIGHVTLLYGLTRIYGAGVGVLYGLQWLYALMLVGLIGSAYGLMGELLPARDAGDAALVLTFSPLALYLCFKTMSEVPSILLVTLGSWAFVRGLIAPSRRGRLRGLALATIALTGGMLCRVTTIVAFGGLGVALLIVGHDRIDRRTLWRPFLLVGMTVAVCHSAVLALAGADVLRIASHIRTVVTQHRPIQRVYGFVFFVQGLGVGVPFAWLRRRERWVRLAMVWFAGAILPFLAGHEPRYYVTAMIPLAILAAVGFREISRLAFARQRRWAWMALLAVIVAVDRVALAPLMPYEVDQRALLDAFASLETRAPGATILVPWTSDFSALRFAHPEAPVELCLSSLPDTRAFQRGRGPELAPPDLWWVGEGRYVGFPAALAGLRRPWFYLGWTYSPPALRLERILARVHRAGPLAKGKELHNHLSGSWIWHSPSLALTERLQVGQYHGFELRPREVGGR